MGTARKSVAVAVKVGVVGLLTAGSLLTVATAANASFRGNTVNNCYGIAFTRDWNQDCGTGGAGATGNYRTDADCNSGAPDEGLTRFRNAGDTTSVDGDDCNWGSVRTITTWYN